MNNDPRKEQNQTQNLESVLDSYYEDILSSLDISFGNGPAGSTGKSAGTPAKDVAENESGRGSTGSGNIVGSNVGRDTVQKDTVSIGSTAGSPRDIASVSGTAGDTSGRYGKVGGADDNITGNVITEKDKAAGSAARDTAVGSGTSRDNAAGVGKPSSSSNITGSTGKSKNKVSKDLRDQLWQDFGISLEDEPDDELEYKPVNTVGTDAAAYRKTTIPEPEPTPVPAPAPSNGPPAGRKPSKNAAKDRWKRRRELGNMRFSALAILLITVGYLGILALLLFFPRSTISEIENRTLAEFPAFSLNSYFSADYTSDIATWFDDTVPYRDSLKNLGYSFSALFGFSNNKNTITFINQDVVANDMNAATADSETADGETATDVDAESESESETETEEEAVPTPTEEPDQTDYTAQEADFDLSNGLLVVYQNGHWKCLGLFGGGSGNSYISALNTLQEAVGSDVTIYSMPCPLASQFYVPSNAASYSSDQNACFESIAEQLDSRIVSINICSVLAKHTDEDIYLRTDHHWAPLGAYYAARTFAEAAGVSFTDITDYIVGVNQGYVGTMYAYSKDSRILNDPEDFVYYIPQNDYTTYYYNTSFSYSSSGRLIQEVSVSNSYLMFMGGDEKIVKVVTDVDDGRKLLVIKDSYGNAEIPFYTSSFEEIYVIDMRYFKCNLINFIEDLGITDVLFTMCSYSVVGSNANNLSTLLTQNADERVVDQQVVQAEEEAAAAAAAAAEEAAAAAAAEAEAESEVVIDTVDVPD